MGRAESAVSMVGGYRKLTWRALWSDFVDNGDDTGDHTASVSLPTGFFVMGGTFRVITEFKGGTVVNVDFGVGHHKDYAFPPAGFCTTGSRDLNPDGNLQAFHASATGQGPHQNQSPVAPIIRAKAMDGSALFADITQGEVEVTLHYAMHAGL